MVIDANWGRGAGATIVGTMEGSTLCSCNYMSLLVLVRMEEASIIIAAMLYHWVGAAQWVSGLITSAAAAGKATPPLE